MNSESKVDDKVAFVIEVDRLKGKAILPKAR